MTKWVVAYVFGRVFGGIVAREVSEWCPWLAKLALQHAVNTLPDSVQERYYEEWSSVLYDTPGFFSKLVRAVGFIVASNRVCEELRKSMSDLDTYCEFDGEPTDEEIENAVLTMIDFSWREPEAWAVVERVGQIRMQGQNVPYLAICEAASELGVSLEFAIETMTKWDNIGQWKLDPTVKQRLRRRREVSD